MRTGENGEAFAVLHTFGGEYPETVRVPLPEGCPADIAAMYSDTEEAITVGNGCLVWHPTEDFKAAAVHMK